MDWLILGLSLAFLALALTIFLLIFFGVIRVREQTNLVLEEFLNSVSLQNGWIGLKKPAPGETQSDSSPVEGERAGCFFYRTFTLDRKIVDALSPGPALNTLPDSLRCLDGFSLPLTKRIHLCNQDRCAGVDGNIYTKGQTEEFYTECGGDLPNCPNGLSGVVFNPEDLRWCLANQNNRVYVTSCPAVVTPQANTFFAVDYQSREDLPPGLVAVRIRFPGQNLCFFDDLSISPCTDSKDEGFSWVYVPKLVIANELYPPGNVFYPPQIIQYPTLNLGIITDNNDLAAQLVKYPSLQTDGTNYFLGPYSLCNLSSPSSACQRDTTFVSAYNWTQTF